MMGLIGIIIASLVNIFLKSSMMYFVISILGVLIFVGLTAYDTQKIKNMYSASDTGELIGKKAVMGALTLYLDEELDVASLLISAQATILKLLNIF